MLFYYLYFCMHFQLLTSVFITITDTELLKIKFQSKLDWKCRWE